MGALWSGRYRTEEEVGLRTEICSYGGDRLSGPFERTQARREDVEVTYRVRVTFTSHIRTTYPLTVGRTTDDGTQDRDFGFVPLGIFVYD